MASIGQDILAEATLYCSLTRCFNETESLALVSMVMPIRVSALRMQAVLVKLERASTSAVSE